MNVLEELRLRGFVEDTTHDKELSDYLGQEGASCYIGFDPTASSLHIGSLVPIMSLAHMQRHGHRPIALVGGGTGLIGDPSGKTEMRVLLTPEDIESNKAGIRAQLSRFIDFEGDKALMVDNADWLTSLEYIPFLRDIGRHFSVNRMIKAESYRMRIESDEGLSFIEFNYMLLQAYDFMKLSKSHGCMLQMGGSDQWGNIVAGIDLVRRTTQKTAFGLTFPLITTSDGIKMGKTHKGAVWLDPERTSPYEYYQYWVNTDDKDVARFLSLFTFLPLDEIEKVKTLEGADLNNAKAVLAFEATAIAHGREEAVKAYESASSMFGARVVPAEMMSTSTIPRDQAAKSQKSVPTSEIPGAEFEGGMVAIDLFHKVGLSKSKGEARRLITQGGAYVNEARVESIETKVAEADFVDGEIVLRAGKKRYHKVILGG